ncbi:MAG TPA: LuxR C-terminal-related transcriptional regulator [Acidimicrobiales bacterium]|nr:LuxR C-terminal-related transcriptional regulator [Acidimicrobiales bacterium]
MGGSPTREQALEAGRAAHSAKAWAGAVDHLRAAEAGADLEAADLELLAEATYLIGREDEAVALWIRAHKAWLAAGAGAGVRAVRPAFWVTLVLELRGDQAQAGGWMARTQRLVEEAGGDCVEEGYLLFFMGMGQLEEGDVLGASATLARAAELGTRFADADLMAFARMGSGQSLVWLGQQAQGLSLLDEAMVAVTAGEVSDIAAGIVYCALIEACHDAFDLRRATEWTEALATWCASQPDLVPYRGNCQVHRAEILLLRGRWDDAGGEADQAGQRLAGGPSAANAHYQRGEVHRLRGESELAEAAYRQASELGRVPQPGLALLRLAQGQVEAAAASMRRLLGESDERVVRARLLGAAVDILLAAGDVASARAAADELSGHAAAFGSPLLHANAGYAAGAVLLAEDNPRGACETLRRAADAWRSLEVPFEMARTRSLLGVACSQLGDTDAAALEHGAARRTLTQLGARPALRLLDELAAAQVQRSEAPSAGPLTAREVEVLLLLATGRTNKAVAAELVISQKTVARHVANIFTKLGLSSRSAATAYAYEHGLV